jgi:hypothetical protein
LGGGGGGWAAGAPHWRTPLARGEMGEPLAAPGGAWRQAGEWSERETSFAGVLDWVRVGIYCGREGIRRCHAAFYGMMAVNKLGGV